MLIDRGFVRVRPLLGDIDAWIAAGYTVEAWVDLKDGDARAAIGEDNRADADS
ncbi:MAG: hypothetical protein IT530_10370 [Burkholderiales bacterium]|nr:hypothetical protein [Burkholderiales bacterium]